MSGRYALLADVHANLEALDVVLAHVDRWEGAQVLCAGDTVGYGADPEQVIARLRERGALAIAGNHEGMVLGRLGFERSSGEAIRAALWTRQVLSPSARAWLAQLPARLELEDGLLVCHGDLDDPQHYVRSERAARQVLAQAAQRFPRARLIVLGHTHHPLVCPEQGPCSGGREALRLEGRALVNPGSVGQSRDGIPEARYAQYDAATGALRFFSLAYDHARAEARMRRQGLAAAAVLRTGRERPPLEALRDRCTRLLARSQLGCELLTPRPR